MSDALWIAGPILWPLAAALLAFVLRGRAAAWIGLVAGVGALACAIALLLRVDAAGAFRYAFGGWGAPLGIELAVDGTAAVLASSFALASVGIGVHALGYFHGSARDAFWPLWLLVQTALATLVLTADLFNAYVAFEILGLAAVALVALGHGAAATTAAMRYLLVGLLGSLGYLAGIALLYARVGVLDLTAAAAGVAVPPLALGLAVAGLALKSALFPAHGWLPPAHGSAPAPASAALSALVVKGSFVVALRLFGTLAPASGAAQVVAALGGAAVLWGSWQALLQQRLKQVVAYSTVAQLGYLFLAFGLAGRQALAGAVALAASHACAKAALFLAAGNLQKAFGDDRLDRLAGASALSPASVFALAAGGVSIVGLPPSGGFVGKWLLLEAALAQGVWPVAVVLLVGGLLAAGYLVRVLAHLVPAGAPPLHHVPRSMELAALGLALAAIAFGFTAALPLRLVIGEAP
ncbi:complex I subunit 5 family protein [Vulgatibacter sp.]|uniref:complex I subunit 5 family protein n=1 Tax=Vulgatibacter sp. TaxID=1971226 RepID=UPI0035634B14